MKLHAPEVIAMTSLRELEAQWLRWVAKHSKEYSVSNSDRNIALKVISVYESIEIISLLW